MRRLLLCALIGACTPTPAQKLVLDELTTSLAAPMTTPPTAADLDPDPSVLRVVLRAQRLPEPHGGFRYAYNGLTPGPTIEAELGQTLEVELINELDAPTTLHWHGLHVPFAMDGVPWRGGAVAPGERFTYRFVLEQTGTFWYHPHFDTEGQVDGGLYGAVVVRDPANDRAAHDLIALVDDQGEARLSARQPTGLAHGHGPRQRRWLVNGAAPGFVTAESGEHVRLRLINTSNHGYLRLSGTGLRLIATDQGPLAAARSGEGEVLAPGDRVELEFLVGAEPLTLRTRPYSLNGGAALGADHDLLEIRPTGTAAAPAPLRLVAPERVQHPDPGYADVVWSFAGSDRTARWFVNGSRFPQGAIDTFPLGATLILEVRNLSPTEHPYHLHGYAFEVLSRNGVAPAQPTYEDTINVRIRERVRLRIVADNPGDWMSHCHILPHAEDGMMTVLRVER